MISKSLRKKWHAFELTNASPAEETSSRRALLAAYVLLILLIVACFPSVPGPVGTGLDPSWVWGLNMAHAAGFVFGTDLAFTFGPLGFLVYPAFPDINSDLVAITWIGLYLIWVAAVISILWSPLEQSHRIALALMFATTSVVLSLAQINRLEITFVGLAIAAIVHAGRAWPQVILLGVFTGAAALIKLNVAVASGALLVFAMALDILCRRRNGQPSSIWSIIVILMSAPLTMVLLYWIVSGSLEGFPKYLRVSFELVSGYADAMALAGPLWQFGLGLLTVAALFVGIPLVADRPISLVPGLVAAALLGFIEWKQAMTRQDGHASSLQIKLALISIFVFVWARTARDRRLLTLFWSFSLLMGGFILHQDMPFYFPALLQKMLHTHTSVVSFARLNTVASELGAINQEILTARKLSRRASRLIGGNSVDAFPNAIDVVRANGFRWQPRPVMQSYAAYTPLLDGWNAAHLQSDRAADNILLNWEDIDNRNPFSSDPLSWRSILSAYDLVTNINETLLLQRRMKPRLRPPVYAGEGNFTWGEWIPVPAASANEIVVAKAEVSKAFRGRLHAVITRAAPVIIKAERYSGRTIVGRLVVANLPSGIIVSDWPLGADDLSRMFAPEFKPTADRVKLISFHTESKTQYEPTIHLSWWRVRVVSSRTPESSSLQEPPVITLRTLWKPSDPLPRAANAVLTRLRDSLRVTSTGIDPQLTFEMGPDLARYRTLVIRARYDVPDSINVFFGRQVDGRGFAGRVPEAGKWLDLYVQLANNPFWATEHGTTIRFDPASEGGVGSSIEIAEVWGSESEISPRNPDLVFYPARLAAREKVRSNAGKKTGTISR